MVEIQLFSPHIRFQKKLYDLRDFDSGMMVGARWSGLSISETSGILFTYNGV